MVTEWIEWSEAEAASRWDAALGTLPTCNVFQSYRWGEFKRLADWTPARWVARDSEGSIVGMVQVLTKNLFSGVLVGWVPGGPVCMFSEHTRQKPDDLVLALLEAIKSTYRAFCIRFDSYAPTDSSLARAFTEALVRPLFKLNAGYSLHLNLENSLDELRARMTAKHRYCVKKSLNEKLEWKAGSDGRSVRVLLELHDEMVKNKQLDSLRANSNEIISLCRILGPRSVVIFTGYEENVPVASCLVLLFGGKAFYWMAATGSRGREMSASYAMVYRLLEYLRAQGIKQFDFGGIAPGSPAAEGVNHFKRGFGGQVVEHLGEWEWANSKWLRLGMNVVVRYRRGRL